MVDVRLQQYIQEQLNKGYSKEQIQETLVHSGYSMQDITAARPHHSKILVIAILLTISLAVVLSVLFLLSTETMVSDTLTGDLRIETSNIRSGEPLYFTITLSNPPVRVRYSIFDSSGREVTSKEEYVETSTAHDSIVLSYSLPRGDYRLVATATNTELSASFAITGQGSLFRLVDVRDVEPLKNISNIAQKNADEASALCSGFTDNVLADECFLDAALSTDNDSFCTSIRRAQQKDSCYFNIVFSTRRLELCNLIQNKDLVATCGNL
ncbi:MAG TPA: hypothetical protein VJK72_03280 [Candidatus Nanoarchaeia archaeon]|nr:hypothetical protein [Candidatus Nanoarchaeia archaeon]